MLLRSRRFRWSAALLTVALLNGCVQLGDPDYSELEGLVDEPDPFPPVPPDPFVPGDERLSVGYFYEGGRSRTIPINTVTTNYFIFAVDDNDPVATLTYSQSTSDDRIEGLISVEISLNRQPFWGGGILWNDPTDLSEWTTMYVGFKSSDPSFERFTIELQSGDEDTDEADAVLTSARFDPATYGYENDGEWHFLRIPLEDAIAQGWDPTRVRSPFIISGSQVRATETMLIDNLYFTQE